MASSVNADNGVVSGTAGLKSSADNSGVLDLQTNGTTAISISASQVVTFANQPAYTGGTANGVLYLNASKVLTSGSALVFNGSYLGVGSGTTGLGEVEIQQSATTAALWVQTGGVTNSYTIADFRNGSNTPVLTLYGNNTSYFSGSVGIGTSSPLKPLDVSFASGARRFLVSYDDSLITIKGAGSTNAPEALRVIGDNIRFNIGITGSGSEAMRIDSSGRIAFSNNGTSSDRLINAAFSGATTSGANQFGLVLNPTYPNTVTSTLFNMYTGPNLTAGTTVTTVYGHYLEAINAPGSTVTNRWGLYQAGSSDKNYFAGNVAVNNGITFPATQVASADANTLDDYEEGSWTPNLSGSSGGVYTMGGVNAGRYIRIGRMVWATATLQWTGRTTAFSGNLWVTGLPFTSTGNRASGSMGAISYGLSFTAGYGEWNYLIDPGYTSVYIIQNSTTGSGYSHSPNVDTTGLVYSLSIVYEAG